MKKFFALAAVALIATSGAALAKGKTTISLDGYCDVLTIHQNKVLKTAYTMAETVDGCEGFYGNGFRGNVKPFGNVVMFGLRGGSLPDEEYVIEMSYPFVTGNSFIIYGTSDGVNLIAVTGGTYTVNGTSVRGAKPVLSVPAKH
jgi:hypothetical protein